MHKINLLLTTAVIAVFSAMPALADVDGGAYGGRHHWGDGMGWFIGPFMMLLFLGAVVLVVVLLVRGLGGTGGGERRGKTEAMEILRERFARGEIDREEFEQRRQALSD